ncbi:hypothetical protein FBU31_003169, partial [Coemansia sp. 'formosensis']
MDDVWDDSLDDIAAERAIAEQTNRRVERAFINSGYKYGIDASKTDHMQGGFDEGFDLALHYGKAIGIVLGALLAQRSIRKKLGAGITGMGVEGAGAAGMGVDGAGATGAGIDEDGAGITGAGIDEDGAGATGTGIEEDGAGITGMGVEGAGAGTTGAGMEDDGAGITGAGIDGDGITGTGPEEYGTGAAGTGIEGAGEGTAGVGVCLGGLLVLGGLAVVVGLAVVDQTRLGSLKQLLKGLQKQLTTQSEWTKLDVDQRTQRHP